MRIIIEGPDGVGKTTLVRKLADHFGCNILVMTENGSKEVDHYCEKSNLSDVVSDRSFISEMVYCLTFERKSKLSLSEYERLLRQYQEKGWIILILDASAECLRERLNIRGDEDEYKVQAIAKLRTFYRAVAYFYDLPVIDSENLNVEMLIKNLEAGKYGPNHCKQH